MAFARAGKHACCLLRRWRRYGLSGRASRGWSSTGAGGCVARCLQAWFGGFSGVVWEIGSSYRMARAWPKRPTASRLRPLIIGPQALTSEHMIHVMLHTQGKSCHRMYAISVICAPDPLCGRDLSALKIASLRMISQERHPEHASSPARRGQLPCSRRSD